MQILQRGTFHIIVISILAISCGSFSLPLVLTESANLNKAENEIIFIAKVRWISLEGGFYGLVAEDGRKFLPLNLADDFRKDGLKIKVRGIMKKDVATIYMWGTPLEIVEIAILN
jgi:hypothetical protein